MLGILLNRRSQAKCLVLRLRHRLVRIATTRCWPRVSVPVLSNTTAVTSLASSSPRRSRTRSPLRAPSVVERATTRGTARPSACGQAMTSTVTTRSTVYEPGALAIIHAIAVTTAAPIATSVSQKAARSASTCALDRDVCASSTRRMMPASAVPLACACNLDAQRAVAVHRPRDHLVAGALRYWSRLAGDHRLVHRAVPLAHGAVGRHATRRAARARGRPRAARRREPPPCVRRRCGSPCWEGAWPIRRARPVPARWSASPSSGRGA